MCLERVQDEVRDQVQLDLQWKSYLLRPYAEPKPLDKFRRYTQSWMRPAEQPDAGDFRVWATDEDPPSHSIPSAVAVKAAERQGQLPGYHRALMQAYFSRNLNVTSRATMVMVAGECGLDLPAFERDLDDPELANAVVADHNEAVEMGISGVPCVVLAGGFLLPGSQERAVYRNIIQRLLAREGNA